MEQVLEVEYLTKEARVVVGLHPAWASKLHKQTEKGNLLLKTNSRLGQLMLAQLA